jgi:hypothetical protein
MAIDPHVQQQIITAWQDAPYGHKTATVEKWSAMTGLDKATIYRFLPDTGRTRTSERKIAGIEEAARVVAAIKNSPPEHRGVISTVDAQRIALINGKIDAEFSAIPYATFDRVIRELGLNAKRRRVEPFQAEYPNEMHHVDASSSDCLYIAKALPDGDFLLKLHRGVKGYKNKPIPVDGLRPWIYGLTDDHSGMHCCRYVAAKGENAGHNMEFLCWAWWEMADKYFWGVPKKIKGDHGPMMESPAAQDFFDRCIVEIDPSEPLNKETHGKIERPWRTIWQKFELPFFAMSDWKRFEITLSELNSQLIAYSQAYNEQRHRYERRYSRRQMWERISLNGGVRILPPDALETIAKSNIERTVGQDGVFWMDNIPYEVKGLHDAKVKVIVGIYDKTVVVQDLADGTKYEVEAFTPNKLGEFHANPETGQQQMRKEAAKLDGITTTIYSKEGRKSLQSIATAPVAAEPRKVLKMPTRVKETIKLANPLDIDRFADIGQAIKEFQALTGLILDSEERAAVSAMIEENGLSRRYVAGLAAEVEHERSNQRVAL